MSDYDYQPKVGGNKYLTLKSKGDLVDIRIASSPIHKRIHWITNEKTRHPQQADHEGQTCQTCDKAEANKDNRMASKEIFGWVVLDRNDESKPKIFKGGTSIYLAIKGLAESKAWGDPQGYDIEIKRTEEKPMYYSVTPLPEKSKISEAELKAIKEANLNLEAEINGGKTTNTFGKDEEIDTEEVVKELGEEIE